MFLDHADITVTGGNGGNGCVAWRREKYMPNGGPNGGDGGNGGNVYFLADPNTDTLSAYASVKKFQADRGKHGLGSDMAGRGGEDMILRVPPGTLITDISDPKNPVVFADLQNPGDQILVAKGGRGGYGNAHFKSSTRQAPDFAEMGEPGHARVVKLDLKLVADVGIIGYPSVGKSTLISVISAARPKIADYPFTTLIPNLGVVHVVGRSYVVCDIPGLIEGASEGKGLGDKFLRHIERCGVLVHLLDISRALHDDGSVDVDLLEKDYQAIRHELSAYSPTLAAKRELILLNKIDLTPNDVKKLESALKKKGIPVFMSISAATHGGTEELTKKLLPIILEERQKRQVIADDEAERLSKEIPVLQPHLDTHLMGAYRIELTADAIVVTGTRLEQFTSMVYFDNESAVQRFRDVAERIGLVKALRRELKEKPLPVLIGGIRVDEYLF